MSCSEAYFIRIFTMKILVCESPVKKENFKSIILANFLRFRLGRLGIVCLARKDIFPKPMVAR